MAVFQQCPICRTKQKNSLKKCRSCGEDLVKAKKSNRVKYWICNQIQKKKIWKSIGYSIQDAQDADGKIRAEKRENPFFNARDNNLTFNELSTWYTGLLNIQKKKYYKTILKRLKKWNAVFGEKQIIKIRKSDIDNYQATMLNKGYAEGTIDLEVFAAKMIVQAAIDDDRITGDCIKPFRKIKRLLRGDSNARNKIITPEQLFGIIDKLPQYLHGIVSLGFFGGMRQGEIVNLTWDKVNLQHEVPHIKLEKGDTKEGKGKIIPLVQKVRYNPYDIIKGIPKALHDNHVFLLKGHKIGRTAIERRLKLACEGTGIAYGKRHKDGFIFHDLRHCFNTYMRRAGVDQLTIMRIMGHSPGRGFEMTYRYSTFELRDLGEAIGRMEGYLMEQTAFKNERSS